MPDSNFNIEGKASCKKINSLVVWDARRTLSFSIVRPAEVKTCSEGAEVAGIHNILEASIERYLYFLAFTRHQDKDN